MNAEDLVVYACRQAGGQHRDISNLMETFQSIAGTDAMRMHIAALDICYPNEEQHTSKQVILILYSTGSVVDA